MAKINNLYYHPSTYKEWNDLDRMVQEELQHEYLQVNEVLRVEDDINISFEIEDDDYQEEVLTYLKQYCNTEREQKDLLDYFDAESGEGELPKEVILNILTKALKKCDSRIKVVGLYAEYYGVLIRFEFEQPTVKNAISIINKDSVVEDLKNLISKVLEEVNVNYLEQRVEHYLEKGEMLDFLVEDILKDYMELHCTNYTFDILDGDEYDKTIVSIATGC